MGVKKGPWSPEEDRKLIDYVQKHGFGNWRAIPRQAGNGDSMNLHMHTFFISIS